MTVLQRLWRLLTFVLGSSRAAHRLVAFLSAPALVLICLPAFSVEQTDRRPEGAEQVFRQDISAAIVQAKCVNCHVSGGASGHTRLVFVRSVDAPDHRARNLQTLAYFVVEVQNEGGGSYILNKVQGVQHGGGVQVPVNSPEFASMQRFLELLGEEIEPAQLTPATLFDTVVLASPRQTLRRASLIFAGRIPTEDEYAAVEAGDESALRATIRGLMEGPQFHEFLLRASNDRLLTDRLSIIIDMSSSAQFVDLVNENYRRKEAAHAIGDERAWRDYWYWHRLLQFGFRRAPLELIAHVVENDLPYTEILTADYIMANPWAASAYGASTHFDDPEDEHEFRPSQIVSYYRTGDDFESEGSSFLQATRVLNPGSLRTDYPHAGILNTTSFLLRYPSTATNRNRARSRWTYYHFLGLDVEKSASRTTDAAALADTDNPTMNNPACTVCHTVLDPVAGAFQNYGDQGLYRDQPGGLDSLDDLYKEGKVAAMSVQAELEDEPQTLVWPVTLFAGTNTLQVLFTNPFHYDEEADVAAGMWLDRLDVVDSDGGVLASHEFEDLEVPVPPWEGLCGEAGDNSVELYWGEHFCAFHVHVDVPADGAYSIEVVAWSNGNNERYRNDGFARLSVSASAYQVGDTWFRDMRAPGFNNVLAPNAGNSVQWLARKIAADPRFAEATVRFWWPAIMGQEVARPPEVVDDADFDGRLLAANAQGAEVTRLAQGFRHGFPGGLTYNVKDLLVEIVLSEWFRAEAVTDADPVRQAALRYAGAKRLLTPEELARKTAAVTGVQWGRHVRTNCFPECERTPSSLTHEYRLLYGGIDSDGVTERARDSTSVMAGVARRHAVAVSCSVVMREFYLVDEGERLLFGGIEVSEHGAAAVKDKLVELHDRLLGVKVSPDSADVAAAYRLFAEVRERARASGHHWFEWTLCETGVDEFFFEGILNDLWVLDEYGGYEWDFERAHAFLDGIDFSDPHAAAHAWKIVLAYLMMDPRYLYLF